VRKVLSGWGGKGFGFKPSKLFQQKKIELGWQLIPITVLEKVATAVLK